MSENTNTTRTRRLVGEFVAPTGVIAICDPANAKVVESLAVGGDDSTLYTGMIWNASPIAVVSRVHAPRRAVAVYKVVNEAGLPVRYEIEVGDADERDDYEGRLGERVAPGCECDSMFDDSPILFGDEDDDWPFADNDEEEVTEKHDARDGGRTCPYPRRGTSPS